MHPRVLLRELKQEDVPIIAELANNIKIFNNVRDAFGHPYTEENAQRFFEHQAESDTEVVFAIETDGKLCGLCGLILQDDVYGKSAEVGYWLGEPFWGKGIATSAIGLLVSHAFKEFKLIRLYAGVFEYNSGSMRVLEKVGFVKEGISRKAVFKNGKFWDEHRYAVLKI
ncbi:GNAT family N-acetyltransferase [Maribacter litopenaei]|uniref:GNAT family N-acetyltransferase n=1 Tax=Maribacter litopenaei TaxID=2976127 RepID=A0ABY5YD38_9FLAO|nr:GNAT family protein [Maribacter litopenaei]UWX56237.1 GNAT family N-acetyltransferase [Maribacter litopenaei]